VGQGSSSRLPFSYTKPNTQLLNKERIQESVGQLPCGICIKDGIIVVPKEAAVPDGTIV
jgi:hypothetical protein